MNITQGSVVHWVNITSYDNDNSNRNNNTSSNNNNSSTLDRSAGAGGPNPQLWDLRWFALLSGPLLFGTIIIPLITGPALRYICRSYVTLRGYWRLGFALFVVVYPIVYYSFIYSLKEGLIFGAAIANIILDSALTFFVVYQLYNAWRIKKRRGLWSFCICLVALVWLLDIGLITSTFYELSYGYFGWILMFLVLAFNYRREGVSKRRASARMS